MYLDDLNSLSQDRAVSEFLRCCGARRWARLMSERRPFSSIEEMREAADTIWWTLQPEDWLEAFSAHPRIGELGRDSFEQSGMNTAPEDLRARLAGGNRAYEQRFGYIFIVCATGKAAGEMLAILEGRLANMPEVELPVAAEQQRLITRIRLDKLLEDRRP